jgi:hypothetical protein
MKSYDPNGCCPKCGYSRLTTRFYAAIGTLDVEHIRRSCDRCRHEFREAPLDAPPTAPTPAAAVTRDAAVAADNSDREQIERLNTAAHAGVTSFPVGPGGMNLRD